MNATALALTYILGVSSPRRYVDTREKYFSELNYASIKTEIISAYCASGTNINKKDVMKCIIPAYYSQIPFNLMIKEKI